VEVLKIVGGLAAIAVVVAIIALDRKEDTVTAAAAVPPERTFEAQDSSARFIVPEAEPAEGESAAAGAATD
jgi:hypothetical protein